MKSRTQNQISSFIVFGILPLSKWEGNVTNSYFPYRFHPILRFAARLFRNSEMSSSWTTFHAITPHCENFSPSFIIISNPDVRWCLKIVFMYKMLQSLLKIIQNILLPCSPHPCILVSRAFPQAKEVWRHWGHVLVVYMWLFGNPAAPEKWDSNLFAINHG